MPRPQDDAGEPARAVATLSFEAALAELEAIVNRLEQGQGALADAIADYERGTLLRRHCEAKLGEAEARVQAIVDGPDGPTGLRDAAG
jgi:exodeoxyribonuclease VII small subunit